MKGKILGSLILSILALVILASFASAATLADWALTASTAYSSADSNLAASALTSNGVTGLVSDATNGATSSGWSTSTVDATKYYQVTLAPKLRHNFSLSTLSFNYISTNATASNIVVQYSKNSDFSSSQTIISIADLNTTSNLYNTSLASAITVNDGETLYLRFFAYSLSAAGDTVSIKNLNLTGTVSEVSFCSAGTIGVADLSLNVDVRDRGKGDDNKWLPLDTIDVEVELENDKTVDLNSVVFELALYKKGSTNNIIDDMVWISEDDNKFEFGDIDSSDSGKHVFEFKVDPQAVDAGNYILMVKAYPSGEQSTTCVQTFGGQIYQEITIDKESDRNKMVIVDDKSIVPITASCGEEVTLNADVYNVGDRDFQDQFMVSLYNKELGIDLKQTVYNDLDAGDKKTVSFVFRVPQNAEEKVYALSMYTYYEYDKNGGNYETYYDRKSDTAFQTQVTVSGSCIVLPSASVSAKVESGGKAGEELVVKATITNTDSKARTFTITAENFNSWAELVSTEPSTVTLEAGKSREILFTFNVDKTASGENDFNIGLKREDGKVFTQPASVIIESPRFSLISGNVISGGNWYIWAIGAFNVVLVIVIISIAVKVAKRR